MFAVGLLCRSFLLIKIYFPSLVMLYAASSESVISCSEVLPIYIVLCFFCKFWRNKKFYLIQECVLILAENHLLPCIFFKLLFLFKEWNTSCWAGFLTQGRTWLTS